VIGEDGEGYDLRWGLTRIDVGCVALVRIPRSVATPTYTKPMRDGREMERFDIKNRKPMSESLEQRLLKELGRTAIEIDGVIIADQVEERNCGVITDALREALPRAFSSAIVAADSRVRIGEFTAPCEAESKRGDRGDRDRRRVRRGSRVGAANGKSAFVHESAVRA